MAGTLPPRYGHGIISIESLKEEGFLDAKKIVLKEMDVVAAELDAVRKKLASLRGEIKEKEEAARLLESRHLSAIAKFSSVQNILGELEAFSRGELK